MTREEKRYAVIFRSLLPVFSVLLRKYRFRTDHVQQMDEPFLMLANHATEVHHYMAACAAQTPMTFVCGEHLLRGKHGKLLKNIADPIPVPKGASAVLAVKEILRRLRRGENVMLFPEGSRSFHGETLPMTNAIGKLVKMGRAALVTYRIQGGYFVAPRWAYHFRKGPMEGHVVNVYSSEQLKGMTAEEITEAINRDLYENAYETQRRHPQRYLGKGLAEGLENYLVCCPRCGGYDTLESEDNRFRCRKCGLEGVHDEYGMLLGENLPFRTVYDWGKWIETRFDADMAERMAGELLFTDSPVRLYEIDAKDHSTLDRTVGNLKLYHDRMEIGAFVFPFAKITEMSMLYFGKSLLFTCSGAYYGMTGPVFHAWKADRLYRLYQKGE